MVDKGYQTFSVVVTSIIIAIIILLLIIMFLNMIVNKNTVNENSGFFNKIIWHCDIFGRLIGTRLSKTHSYQLSSNQIDDPKEKLANNSTMNGGCGNCNSFSLSSSLTYDPQIFLKKRKH